MKFGQDLEYILKVMQELCREYGISTPYIVGGLPRDIYLNESDIKTSDIDITTNSSDVLRLGILLADRLNVTFEVSDDGHATVFSDYFDIDFSSHFISKSVVKYMKQNNLNIDLAEAYSRDFTINTLHLDISTKKILDFTEQGLQDIKNAIIRTPVPPEITLKDDPRRVYRAINLAARYGYNVDESIKKYVLENSESFGIGMIKDKYISVKIAKALKHNSEVTIQLLKDFGLFRSVPLVGIFKDILIEKKLLAEYLGGEVD